MYFACVCCVLSFLLPCLLLNKSTLMQVMLLSGCIEPLFLKWLLVFSSVTEIKNKIPFARSEDSHSAEGAHMMMRCPWFHVITNAFLLKREIVLFGWHFWI